jgi:hypothetical protein
MKKTAYFVAFAMFLGSFTLNAQTDTSATSNHYTYVTAKPGLTDKFLPMPGPLTMEKIFPATGNFQSTQTNIEGAADINITLDSVNKGMVWIEGLPMGKVKAQLRQSPATYRIPAQKTEDGKSIAEGTLVYDTTANVLNICLGCNYDETEPAKPFTIATETVDADATAKAEATAKAKKAKSSKVKVWNYTGAKVIVEQAPVTDEMQNQQQLEAKPVKENEQQ